MDFEEELSLGESGLAKKIASQIAYGQVIITLFSGASGLAKNTLTTNLRI